METGFRYDVAMVWSRVCYTINVSRIRGTHQLLASNSASLTYSVLIGGNSQLYSLGPVAVQLGWQLAWSYLGACSSCLALEQIEMDDR